MSSTNKKRRLSSDEKESPSPKRSKKEKSSEISWDLDLCYRRNAEEIFREVTRNKICVRDIAIIFAEFAASEYKKCVAAICESKPFMMMDEELLDGMGQDAPYVIIKREHILDKYWDYRAASITPPSGNPWIICRDCTLCEKRECYACNAIIRVKYDYYDDDILNRFDVDSKGCFDLVNMDYYEDIYKLICSKCAYDKGLVCDGCGFLDVHRSIKKCGNPLVECRKRVCGNCQWWSSRGDLVCRDCMLL